MAMVKKWKGLKEIKEKATKELVQRRENGYFFYSAPSGYRLILSIVIDESPEWNLEVRDIGIPLDDIKNGILRRGFLSGDEGMIKDDNNPVLELVKTGKKIDLEELKKNIREEREKAKLRVQGRKYDRS